MSISYQDIEVGDTVYVATGWGKGEIREGVVVGKEKDVDNDGRFVIDYYVDGDQFDHWAYDYQIQKLIKEKV